MESNERSIEKEKMLELKEELDGNVKNMTYLSNVNLLLNNREQVILVEKELEDKKKEYELYKVEEEGFKKISEYDDIENKLVLTEEYIEGELEKAGIEQKLEVKLSPEEIRERAESAQDLETIEKSMGADEVELEEEQEEEMNQDEIDTQAIQEDLGIELAACYKIEDEEFASDVLGRETGEDHFIGVEKGTGKHIVISGNSKGGYHENNEVNPSIGGGEAARQNSGLVITDKKGKPVMAIDSKEGNFYALENDEDGNTIAKRIDTRPMDVAEKQKHQDEVKKNDLGENDENDENGFTPGPDLEERTTGPKYW